MKIDRQLAILTILLRREQVTAPQLANRLEVTRRTIGRDIDDLCRAGIPIVTRQGAGGGISIAEGFSIDRSLLSREESQSLLAGLRGLESVGDSRVGGLMEKLRPSSGEVLALSGNIVIDLASYAKESLSMKIGLLREAIAENRLAAFRYYSPTGTTDRVVEPALILFKWGGWYVQGFCVDRQDFRMFKLARLWELRLLEDRFTPRLIPPEKLLFDGGQTDHLLLTLLVHPSQEYRLVETYGPDSFRRTEEGMLLFEQSYTNEHHMLQWVLSFGAMARVLGPEPLREAVRREAEGMLGWYL